MREIRNSESHEKLVIKGDSIYLLDGNDARELKTSEIFEIASFLKACIGFVSHFYLSLLLREKFWVFLSIFILRQEKYKNANIPFYILKSIEKSKESRPKTENIFSKEVAAIFEIALKYLLYQLWVELENETNRTNARLEKMNLSFDDKKISKLHSETLLGFYNLIYLFTYKTKQLFWDLQKNIEN